MSVFRTHHERNYTLIDNIFMRDTKLSNSTIGLACKMFSLPPDWEFSEKGLAAICKDGVTSIRTSLHELEANGYLIRTKIRKDGRVIGINYDLFEIPKFTIDDEEKLDLEKLSLEIKDNIIKKELNKDNNKDTISKDIGESKDSPSNKSNNKSNISNKNKDIDKNKAIDSNNNSIDDNLKSRNLQKVLLPYIQESFSNDDVKQILTEWLLDVFANGKTLTLKQLINQCDILVANSSSKEELIDMVKKTLESKWATFRYVIEKKQNIKVLNKPNNNIRITEQKRTSSLGNEIF